LQINSLQAAIRHLQFFMRTITTILFLGLVAFRSSAQNIANDTAKYMSDHYRQRMVVFHNEPVVPNEIIFLGNSITEFGDWQKLLNNPKVINRGIAGDNTFGVLARLSEVTMRRPAKIFIEIGINDFSLDTPLQVTINNILAIVHRIHQASPKTAVYVTGILPTNSNAKTDYPFVLNKGRQTAFINAGLAKKAQNYKFTYIGLGKWLKDNNGNLDTKYAKPDGIHLNESAYQLWIKLLKTGRYI
jgi:lysophospholipase L1-like esterase